MQEAWFRDEICNRNSKTRYTGIYGEMGGKLNKNSTLVRDIDELIGYGGIENIQWENKIAEISVLIAPFARGFGAGKEAVGMILDRAFKQYGLLTIFGECYYSSPAVDFWKKIVKERDAFGVDLPRRKFFNGRLWPSYYFSFTA